MNNDKLKEILDKHVKWIHDQKDGERANLSYTNLSSADLSYTDLRSANLSSTDLSYTDLSYADLRYANLSSADLSSADLSYTDLRSANLSSTNLSYTNLSYTNLSSADLSYTDLRSANLSYTNLSSADLSYTDLRSANLRSANLRSTDLSYAEEDKNTKWPDYFICPEIGEFIAWKKGSSGCLIKLLIQKSAKRTSSLIGRKCRASKVKVLAIWDINGKEIKECAGWNNNNFIYRVGRVAYPDSYDPGPRIECSYGIHFFITRKEAEEL